MSLVGTRFLKSPHEPEVGDRAECREQVSSLLCCGLCTSHQLGAGNVVGVVLLGR